MTDFVKLILKQKNRGFDKQWKFWFVIIFQGGPSWNLFCFMKKVRLVLASPTHKKMRESLIFFQTWKKMFCTIILAKGSNTTWKNWDFQKKTQWTQNLHVTENWVSRPWNGSWKKQNVFWKAELISDMTDKVVFWKSKFKAS